jgi:hypothetical protein
VFSPTPLRPEFGPAGAGGRLVIQEVGAGSLERGVRGILPTHDTGVDAGRSCLFGDDVDDGLGDVPGDRCSAAEAGAD